jgi:hypothetical protein
MLIHGELFGLDDLVLQGFEMIIVQCKPPFDRAIGQALLALEQREHLGEDLVEGHSRSPNPLSRVPRIRNVRRGGMEMGKALPVYHQLKEGAGEIAPRSTDRGMGALRQRSNRRQKKGNGLSSAVALTLHP